MPKALHPIAQGYRGTRLPWDERAHPSNSERVASSASVGMQPIQGWPVSGWMTQGRLYLATLGYEMKRLRRRCGLHAFTLALLLALLAAVEAFADPQLTRAEAVEIATAEARRNHAPAAQLVRPKVTHSAKDGRWEVYWASTIPGGFIFVTVDDKTRKATAHGGA